MTASQNDSITRLASDLRSTFRRLKVRLREHSGHGDLTAAQTSVILRLENDGPLTVSSLARAESMRPQSMSAIVAPLQDAGLLRGLADPGDGRKTMMTLTPKCLQLLETGRAARQDWLTTKIEQNLSVEEQKTLQQALALLIRLVDQ